MNDAWVALLTLLIGVLPGTIALIQNRRLRRAQAEREEAEINKVEAQVEREEAETARTYVDLTAMLSQATRELVADLRVEIDRQNERIAELKAEIQTNTEAMSLQQTEITTLQEMVDKALYRIDFLEIENSQLKNDNRRLQAILDKDELS